MCFYFPVKKYKMNLLVLLAIRNIVRVIGSVIVSHQTGFLYNQTRIKLK